MSRFASRQIISDSGFIPEKCIHKKLVVWTEERNPSVASVHTRKRVNSSKCMEQSLTTITTRAALEDHSPVFDVNT